MAYWLLSIPLTAAQSDTCLKDGYVALGEKAPVLPDLSSVTGYELRKLVESALPDESPEAILLATEPVWAFLHDWLPEDIILLALHEKNEVWVGHVEGPYQFAADALPGLQHRRKIRWEHKPFTFAHFAKEYNQPIPKSFFIREFPDTNGLSKLKLDLDPKPNRKFLHRAQILFSLACSVYILFMALKQAGFF